jgi:hypothetical protein
MKLIESVISGVRQDGMRLSFVFILKMFELNCATPRRDGTDLAGTEWV